jgi:hypothetical protein
MHKNDIIFCAVPVVDGELALMVIYGIMVLPKLKEKRNSVPKSADP